MEKGAAVTSVVTVGMESQCRLAVLVWTPSDLGTLTLTETGSDTETYFGQDRVRPVLPYFACHRLTAATPPADRSSGSESQQGSMIHVTCAESWHDIVRLLHNPL